MFYYDKGKLIDTRSPLTAPKDIVVKVDEKDIAPVKKTSTSKKKKKKKDKWYEGYLQGGAFDDGYQFGDITKTITASSKDLKENFTAGILGMGEQIVDAGATVLGNVGGALGADDFKKKTEEFIKKDLYDEKKVARNIVSKGRDPLSILNPINNNPISNSINNISSLAGKNPTVIANNILNGKTDNSILGDKTDSLIQSGGQLAATGVLSGAVPWYLTTGTTAFGGQAETALKEGATLTEATGSALISAGAEVLFEKLGGGINFKGGKTTGILKKLAEKGKLGSKTLQLMQKLDGNTLDDLIIRPLTEKISNKILRASVNLGLDAGGEGIEEVLTSIASRAGTALYKEDNIEELLWNEEAMDEYIDSFVGGALMGGVAGTGRTITNNTKTDTLTENEKKVVDKEFENRISEAEKDGKKLSEKDKTKIYDEVLNDLDKGYISTDTIESALGDKTYETYKTMEEQENSLKKEIESLENTPKEQFTVKQDERLKELREELAKIDKTQVKNQLSSEVSELAKVDRLSESYNEKARRSEAFKADLSKYDTKQQEVIKRATESGILNNTNRTHEFVDMVAKISADKGVLFDFTNNQKLKESGFAVEGKTVNGYVKDGNIAVNIDSNKSLNTIVGHEITHVLEGTELYNELQQAVKEYAKTKGEYFTRRDELARLYRNVENVNLGNEVTADLVGDYLFTDKDFINNLSVEKPNIFKKIYNEIKYLYKMVTAGSKEARQLEKVKRTFENAYKQTSSNTEVKTDTKADDTRHRVEPEQIKNIDNTKPTDNADINLSMTNKGQNKAPYGKYNVYGKDITLEQAPVQEVAPVQQNNQAIDYAPLTEEQANERDAEQSLTSMESEEFEKVVQSYMDDAPGFLFDEDDIRAWAEEQARQNPQGATPKENTAIPESPLEERDIEEVGNRKIKAYMYENPEVKPFFQEEAQNMLWELQNTTRGERLRQGSRYGLDEYEIGASDEGWYGTKRQTSDEIAYLLDSFKYSYKDIEKGLKAIIEDHGAENNAVSKRIEFMLDERLREGYNDFMSNEKLPPNQDYINLLNEKQITEYNDEAFNNWVQTLKDEDIAPVEESIEHVLYSLEETKNKELSDIDTKLEEVENAEEPELSVNESYSAKLKNYKNAIVGYKDARTEIETAFDDAIQKKTKEYEALQRKDTKKASDMLMQIENLKLRKANNLSNIDSRIERTQTRVDNMIKNSESVKQGMYGKRRKALHNDKMNEIKSIFSSKGFDFDKVLREAKNKSTFASVDNTPQRFMEKTLGYKEGQTLADLTVNKVAQNESQGIRWVNENVSLLKQISKEYGIKPRSKESAAAQMYAEGFYVDENDKLVKYGNKELAKDFEDAKVRENIKKLAKDARIRSIYDETLDQINKSRIRNAYPEIPKRDNYFLHFIEMDDAFSRLGIPFNPNDIKAKDLPTDINGMTVDLKPGQPYFASAMHRKGYKTTYDLLGGVERYLNSAKNQIFHIDDIQTLRATRNYIADMFGQSKGLEDLDTMTETEASERIEQVFGSHLSNFAKFLHEEANVIAGKTALIDRGLEGIIGRRGISFLNTLNGQVGSNMVGYNVSSSLTNFISVMQSMAKSSKIDTLKAFTQTASNKIGSMFGKTDGFAENNPAIIRRKGIDTFARKPFEKISDSGYVLMSAVDDISTEIIVRTKFNELTRKGMSEEQAHIEADKWAHRILGDRSLGQQPLLYNSKMLGIITKFQLEVRNQLDSQFYDTIQEAKVSTEDINNAVARNAVKSAKVASTMVQLAVLQHVFGKAFESVAGYNPAFDIIEVLMQTFGLDDEEDSEDTALDNVEQGFLALLEDLPYSSVLTGGRIPISSALPIKELVTGKDNYGQEISRTETLKEVAPYYLLPTGYGQIKKTKQGLDMFSDEHPTSGSYTDSGDLRFPIEDTTKNRIQAGLFGQYANDNARYYFDNNIAPLNEKQIQEYIDVEMPIRDYWNYRDEIKGKKKIEDKADYISNMDIPIDKKNILINNATTRKEPIDLTDYEDYSGFQEFDFATKNPEKYEFLQSNNISYKEYSKDKETREAYNWAFKNPDKYTLSKAISNDFLTYNKYKTDISKFRADKDKYGNSISGTKKEKVLNYINGLDAEYGEKLILFKSIYYADDTHNYEIIDYLNNRDDITYDEMNTILKQLGFTVKADGTIYWN